MTAKVESSGADVASRPLPLQGIRVLDFLWLGAGAWGSRYLASFGAEVIRIEWHEKHDFLRFNRPYLYPGDDRPVDDASPNRGGHFNNINPGKLGISLNIHHPKGKALFRRLLATADVVTENFTATTMERWGLGYNALRAVRPDIIYCQQSGFGHTGPYRDYRSMGPVAAGISGITAMSGLPERPPAGFGFSYLDVMAPWLLAVAVMAALRQRRRTGQGQHLDLSQVGAAFQFLGPALLDFQANGRAYRRTGNASPHIPAAPHGVYRCHGREDWIAIACFDEAQWQALVREMGNPVWASSADFASLEQRLAKNGELDRQLSSWTALHQKYALMRRLQAAGVPAAACQTAADRVERDEQLAARGFFVPLPHSEIGEYRVESIPGRLERTPASAGGRLGRGAPCYAEDNEYVYRELLGLSAKEIEDLKRTEAA